MKLRGKELVKAKPIHIVFPRGDDDKDALVFMAQVVSDESEFEKLVKRPEPPTITRPGGLSSVNEDDPDYQKQLTEYGKKRMAWFIIKSITEPSGISWDKVGLGNPETWDNYRDELAESGLSQGEINYLITKVFEVNSLNEEKLEEARKRFLVGLAEK